MAKRKPRKRDEEQEEEEDLLAGGAGMEAFDLSDFDYRGEHMDEIRAHMGERVRAVREELSLTQEQLAGYFDRTTSWVKQIETGRAWAPPYLVVGLCLISGKSMDWMYGFKERQEEAEERAQRAADEIAKSRRLIQLRDAGIEGLHPDAFEALLMTVKHLKLGATLRRWARHQGLEVQDP